MQDQLREEIADVVEFVMSEGLFRVGDLIVKLTAEVDRLEQHAQEPVRLSCCPGCHHWSLGGFAFCPFCGAAKDPIPDEHEAGG